MLDLIVTQRVNPGMEKPFEDLLREVTKNTLAIDKGCLRYEWYRSPEPYTYILIERWTDREAAQAHLNSDHLAEIMPRYQRCVPGRFHVTMLERLT